MFFWAFVSFDDGLTFQVSGPSGLGFDVVGFLKLRSVRNAWFYSDDVFLVFFNSLW